MKKKGICTKCGTQCEWYYCVECRKKYNSEHHQKNRASILAKKKVLHQKKQQSDEYRKKRNESSTNWYQKNKQHVLERNRKNTNKRKTLIFEKYGNQCACCGEKQIEFLTLDHVENNGAEHRRSLGKNRTAIYSWIEKNNFPETIQLLCYNCNCVKNIYGICPHKR